jgi:acyl dehydratase
MTAAAGGRGVAGSFFDELQIGATYHTLGRTITETDVVQFLNLSRNLEPQFSNREFYEKEWVFKRLASPGALTFAIMTGLFTHLGLLSGTGQGYLGLDELRLPAPLFCGDTLRIEVSVLEKRLSKKQRGIVTMGFIGRNQHDEIVLTCRQTFIVARQPG